MGSSPHVRGAHAVPRLPVAAHGIIPACAGARAARPRRPSARRDHPRICGEHCSMTEPSLSMRGSSPHMCGEHRFGTCPQSQPPGSSPHVRGAPKLVDHRPIVGGIIPACAGSTFGTTGVPYCAMGSSPHVRGARHQPVVEAPAHGIIPACAGSTVGRMNDLMQTQGSSPHVRGALLRKLLRDRPEGIIPACTGSTTRCRTPSSRPWDHPRMCGEHSVPSPGRPPLAGSSPHVRGAHIPLPIFWRGGGIIPACTGSTRPEGS